MPEEKQMATRQQFEQLANQSNVRQFLDLIANAEGVKYGYNTLFGNERFDNLSAHPNISKSFTQTDGRQNSTTAAGRYQFLKGTWNDLSKRYGLADFSPQSQDIGAIALIQQNGALRDVINGDYRTAIGKLGGTWASLPSSKYAQPKKSWEQINRAIGKTNQQFSPEYVPSEMMKQAYAPEYVDPKLMTSSEYQPEYVPGELLSLEG